MAATVAAGCSSISRCPESAMTAEVTCDQAQIIRHGCIAAIETGMRPAWRDTVVAVVTVFGRTARINGSDGTDHGTGTIALAGGAVKGGRVIADWPGLKEADLHEKRDLRATTDLRAVLKGVVRDHLRLPKAALATAVFPDSAATKAVGIVDDTKVDGDPTIGSVRKHNKGATK